MQSENTITEVVGNQVLLICGSYNPLLVDYENFKEMFEVEGSIAIPKNIDWHPMSGGFDTWCQSNCIGHARGCFNYGKQPIPYMITHIYFLRD